MKEHAFFMFQNNSMIELFFENERLVAHKDLDYMAPIPHANWAKGLTTPQLEEYLLDRRISEGRSHRNEIYFGGKSLSKYQEMKTYRGADIDDECWIKYSDDDLSAERVLSSVGSSPKGDQIKWEDGRCFYKQDKFKGEAMSEYLCSLFLQASNCPIPYIPYRLSGSPSVCKSTNYKTNFTFVPFYKIIEREVNLGRIDKINSMDKWLKKWTRLSSVDKVEYVCSAFKKLGVSRNDTLDYLTYMVELDTLVLNIDRHLNNFDLRYNLSKRTYEPMFLFDQGISLCVGEGIFDSLANMRNTRKVKMQPFSTSLHRNRSCLPAFAFAFDVKEFVRLLDSTNTFGKQFLKMSTQFKVLKARLAIVYHTDINGINVLNYLEENGY